jgi:hypothetical protein
VDIIYLVSGILLISNALWIWRLSVPKLGKFKLLTLGNTKLHLEPTQSAELRLKIDILQRLLLFVVLIAILASVFWLLNYFFGFIWLNTAIIIIISTVGIGIALLSSQVQEKRKIPQKQRANQGASRKAGSKPKITGKGIEGKGADYIGDVILPRKVYVGDSSNISINLRRIRSILSVVEEKFSSQDKSGGKFITLQIREDAILEIELQAAALVFGSEKKKQKLSVSSRENLSYRWNCYFPNSGKQLINLIFNVLRSSDTFETLPLGIIEHTIKVVQFAFLTQRQVKILAALIAIVGVIGTVIGIVLQIPSLFHLFGGH